MLRRAWALRLAIATNVLALCLQPLSAPSTLASSNNGHASAASARHERAYAAAWESVQQNYYERTRLNSWAAWRHKFDGKLHTEEQLKSAVNEMLDSLSDNYTFMLTEEDLGSRAKQQQQPGVSKVRILPRNIGYIKLDHFCSGKVTSQMKAALRKLAKTNGIILDLRDNHGGFIAVAHDVYSLLADSGRFMSFEGFQQGQPDIETSILQPDHWSQLKNNRITTERRKANLTGGKPLVVLVNEDTRSASEMLAGALRDNGRGLLIGKPTYGKGVLQETFDIGERLAVKVVTAKYFLPGGSNIHEKGLVPDIEVGGRSNAQLIQVTELLSSAIAESHGSGPRFVAIIEHNGTKL